MRVRPAAALRPVAATISHHLKVLHDAGLLDREKRATWVYYIARPEAMAALASLFTTGNTTGNTTAPGADAVWPR